MNPPSLRVMELHVHDMAPDVTVIIPTRNRWKLLRRTLGSALGQQGVNLEVIVVDDSRLTRPRWSSLV